MLLLTMRVMTIQIIAVFHLPHHPPPGKYLSGLLGMVGISLFRGHKRSPLNWNMDNHLRKYGMDHFPTSSYDPAAL